MKRMALATIVCMMLPAMSMTGKSQHVDITGELIPFPNSGKGSPFPIYNNAGFPDLVTDSSRLVSSLDIVTRTFSTSSCEWVEGSIGATGARRLLRFDVAIANIGNGDLVVGSPSNPKNPRSAATVATCSGSPTP